jgi:hypothetical protein
LGRQVCSQDDVPDIKVVVLLLVSWVRSDVGDDGLPVEPALKCQE